MSRSRKVAGTSPPPPTDDASKDAAPVEPAPTGHSTPDTSPGGRARVYGTGVDPGAAKIPGGGMRGEQLRGRHKVGPVQLDMSLTGALSAETGGKTWQNGGFVTRDGVQCDDARGLLQHLQPRRRPGPARRLHGDAVDRHL